MRRRTRLAALAAFTVLLLPPMSVSAADAAAVQPGPSSSRQASAFDEKVVYHVDDMSAARLAMSNIVNHLEDSPKATIILLANGKGLGLLMAGEKDQFGEYADMISELQLRGVRVLACGNTIEHRHLDRTKLLPGVEVVKAGVVELTRLQIVEHYAYIKP